MTYIADLTDMTLSSGDQRQELWVGWLGSEVERRGPTAGTVRGALRGARRTNQLPDHTLGSHTCEICGQVQGHGQFAIEDSTARYILPNLVIHYVTAHHYKLPSMVEDALRPYHRWWRLW